MIKKLIDVSEHQGQIEWEKVKHQIDGAILRCGYGMDQTNQDDEQFKRNADECTRLGIPFGVYLYSYADTEEKANSEAAHVLRLIDGYKLAYPVYLDLEEAGTEKGAVKRAEIFAEIIEKAGYMCGIYANLNWWENHLKGLEKYTKWIAQYNSTCDYTGANKDIWQYTSKGSIDGISGNVDMNECYRDFPAELHAEEVEKEANGFTVLEWQQTAVKDGFRFPQYGVDGIWGAECEAVAKQAVVMERTTYLYKNLTKLVQKYLGIKVDGLCGPNTDKAIANWQKANGLTADGAVGIKTWKKMLGV